MYQQKIVEQAPGFDPRHIEAYMRIGHDTLDGLSAEQFKADVEIAKGCVAVVGIEQAEITAKALGL